MPPVRPRRQARGYGVLLSAGKLMIPRLKPLLLGSRGRSGSTLLMKILSLHDHIVVRSIFPYENRAAQYYYLCARDEQPYATFTPETFQGMEYRPFPGKDTESVAWSEKHNRTALGADGAALTEAYYRFVAGIEDKPQAQYFAEKLIGFKVLPMMVEAFEEAKVILLQRDPRDVFFSIKSFNKKRGYLGFGEDQGDEPMYAGIINHSNIARRWAHMLGAQAVEVRYEDIIADKHRTLSRLYDALGLESTDEQIHRIVNTAFGETDQVRNHKTTRDEKASIGRWQSEADQEAVALFEKYREILHKLGYE